MSCDIVLIGIGGQGVLTIGELIVRAASSSGIPVSFCPTKGMAQRGGFVKGEVRIGLDRAGMRIPPRGADIVIAMERSEAVKGIPYVKEDGTFILYDEVLLPTGALLGRDRYPEREEVIAAIRSTGAGLIVLDPSERPAIDRRRVAGNVYTLGAAIGIEPLSSLIDADSLERAIEERWPGRAGENIAAYRAGLEAGGARWT